MNNKILDILEFKKIKNEIAKYTITEMGKNFVDNIVPLISLKEIQDLLDETFDGTTVIRINKQLPIRKLADISNQLNRLKIDATLGSTDLSLISMQLTNVSELKNFFSQMMSEEKNLNFRRLDKIVEKLIDIPELHEKLKDSISESGAVLDTASTRLGNIRSSIKSLSDNIRHTMEKYTRGINANYLSEAVITVRDERFVIPVKQEYKSKFGGIIHDQSASGQTLYMEPANVVEMNNNIAQKRIDENNEIQKILRELSDLIRPYINDINSNHKIIARIDVINAKAKYANQINATEPIISADRYVELRQARHPLLNTEVVANDISIGKDYSSIIITGPNTGGKTITLKTLGLLQIMAQSGLFIPTNENSKIAIFDDIFADIGDEQSIEQNLSTFSSHLTNIIDILKKINNRSLVLFDELGAGTDPQEGAALAIAIIEKVISQKSYVVATSHYPELKLFAYENKETINASMEFDIETLKPTYKFLIGIPGSSNAIYIAQKLGLKSDIVENAKNLVDGQSQELNNMIKSLEDQRKRFIENNEELENKLNENKETQNKLNNQLMNLEKSKEDTLVKANKKADELVSKSIKKANKIITELRNIQLNGSSVKEDKLISAKTDLNNLRPDPALLKNKVLRSAKNKQTIKPGDEVKVLTYGQIGTVISKTKDNKYEVQLGILKMKVEQNDLEKISSPKKETKKIRSTFKRSTSSTSGQLDLRGMRYDEAMEKLDKYIDQSILQGYGQVTIVHGRGTGAIRNGVNEYLKSNRMVKHYSYAPDSAGGSGATIVEFK